MIDAALPYLRCPVCAEPLVAGEARSLRCVRGHAFDIAKQGYAGLTAGRTPHSGDSAEMIEAREKFLAAGHYDFIADALAEAAPAGLIVDAGVGTGFYLSRVLDQQSDAIGLGLDVSKPALRRAARAHPRAAAALADLWQPLPVADASAAAVLNVFAPRNAAEYHRVLRPDGLLLVVTPAAEHLRELIDTHGLLQVDPAKEDRLAATFQDHFVRTETRTLQRRLALNGDEVQTLIAMTPSARHATPQAVAAEVTAAITLSTYRPV